MHASEETLTLPLYSDVTLSIFLLFSPEEPSYRVLVGHSRLQ